MQLDQDAPQGTCLIVTAIVGFRVQLLHVHAPGQYVELYVYSVIHSFIYLTNKVQTYYKRCTIHTLKNQFTKENQH